MPKRICILLIILAFMPAGEALAGGTLTPLSRSLIQGPAQTAAFLGDWIIFGTGGGIVLVNTADRTGEHVFFPLEGQPRDIEVRGNTAYVAAFRGGLITIDLSSPSTPRVTQTHALRQATGCAISGRYLYVLGARKRLDILDIVTPLEPVAVGSKQLKYLPVLIACENDILCIVNQHKVEILGVAPNGTLSPISEIELPETVKGGVLENNVLYLVDSSGGAHRWSITDPKAPERLSPFPLGKITGLAVDGVRGCLLTKRGRIIPFHVKDDPVTGELETGKPLKRPESEEDTAQKGFWDRFGIGGTAGARDNFKAFSALLRGEQLVTLDYRDGLSLFKLDGETAEFLCNVSSRGFAVDLFARNDTLYVANGYDGVRIGAVNDDGSIDWIGHIGTIEARDLVVQDNHVILADGRAGLKIIDISDPCNPKLVGSHRSDFFHSAVVADGNYAYIAGGLKGLVIYNITDPARPKLVWKHNFSEVRGIHVEDGFLYFADGAEGFRIYSLVNGRPSSLSVLDTPGWNDDVFIAGDIAYLADGGHGIKTADIKDRKNPRLLGSVDLGSVVRNIHAYGNTVFAAAHTSGIAAVDVSDPARPVITARFQSVDDGRGVYVDRRFVYLASASGGVYVFRYSH